MDAMIKSRLLLLTMLSALVPVSVLGQGTRADYERAESFRQQYSGKVFRDRVRVQWIQGRPQFWYLVKTGPDEQRFILVDAAAGLRRPAFDHKKLARRLSKVSGQEVAANNLPFHAIAFNDDLSAVRFTAFGRNWRCHLDSYHVTEDTAAASEASTVSVLRQPRNSHGGGEESAIRFINRMDAAVDLWWIDESGKRRSYGSLQAGEERRQHTFARHVWLVTNKEGQQINVFEAVAVPGDAIIDGRQLPTPPTATRPPRHNDRAVSPDGNWRALIFDNNVFLRDEKSEDKYQLSSDGTDDFPYLPRFAWSPDATKLVAIQQRVGQGRQIHLIESSPPDQLQPKLHTLTYPKPGDRLAQAKPRLFEVATRTQISISEDLFPNPWSISDVHWQPESNRFTFLYNQRGHQVLRVVVVDAATGATAPLIDETSETFIDYAGKQFLHFVDTTHEIIWMSERDGWNHLYLYDSRTGDVKNQITKGSWVVRGVDRVDEKKRQIWFRAGGIYPEQDPYYIHHCRINFDGSGLVVLTAGNGTHSIEFSPDRHYLLDSYSRVDLPTVTELRRVEDGSLVCELERGDWTELFAAGWIPPERFVAKGRDGTTDIYGVVYRPTNFDVGKKYPVIEKIYAGPHSSFVPKSFAVFRNEQAITELGFVVVQIDGMGTSNRSKAFHNVCWKNLGDAGFPDRIPWIKALVRQYPYLDQTRVGIYGGSAGGQSAMRALLAHGDFYKVAVADCGCHDNRMDKVWWNELWMGWPVGPEYAEQSNVTNAHKLTGKLLLTVGELDRNVDPSSTLQVVNALIKADKDFDFLLVPGAGHGVGESSYGKRRRRDFFVRHLLGVEPRSE